MSTTTTVTLLGARHTHLTDRMVREATALIDEAGIVDVLAQRLWHARRSPAGRPPTLSMRAVFVGLLLAATTEGTVHLSAVSDLLHYHLTPASRAELGVPDRPPTVRGREAGYTAVRRWFHRIVALTDDSPHPKNRRLPTTGDTAPRQQVPTTRPHAARCGCGWATGCWPPA